jgi:hypothetical protein
VTYITIGIWLLNGTSRHTQTKFFSEISGLHINKAHEEINEGMHFFRIAVLVAPDRSDFPDDRPPGESSNH